MTCETTTVQTEKIKSEPTTDKKNRPRRQPPYNVILLDDNDHTYEYVLEMLRQLFGHQLEMGFLLAREVDTIGRVIVDTTSKERAELKRDQIHAYGPDPRLPRCEGSMSSIIEPTGEPL